MPKKNFLQNQNRQTAINEIVGWKTPRLHQASECYVWVSPKPQLQTYFS